jgi:iron complex outermembrane receptor protein
VLKGLGGYVELNYRDAAFMDNANLIQAPNYTLWNLNFHFDPKGGNSQGSGVHVIAEVRNLTDQVYVASASNLSDSISSTTGLQNPASTLANSGGIWAGAKRSLFVGLRIKL